MKDQTMQKSLYVGLLFTGVLCPVILKTCDFSVLSGTSGFTGILAFAWLFIFLMLTCQYRTKKQLLITGVVFMVSYCTFYAGALGSSLTRMLLPAAFGLLVYGGYDLSARIMLRWNRFLITLVFPVVWLCGYLIAYALNFPGLLRVDMLLADMTVLIQSERLIGPVGLSFAVVWVMSMLRYAFANRKLLPAGLSAILMLLLLVPGIIRLYPSVEAAESLQVAYTTGPYVGDFLSYTDVSYEENEVSLRKSVSEAALADAELLVFTEEAFGMKDTDEARFLECCCSLAKENDLAMLVGMDLTDTDSSEGGLSQNKAVLIDSTGEILSSYQKTNLIPFLESSYEAGDGNIPSHTLTLHGKQVKLSYLICYDSNFPAYAGSIDPDTDILLLPSWDWSAITELHSKLCTCLAIENQVSVFKPTYDGLSIAIDPYGQTLCTSSTDTTGFEQLQVVEVPLKSSYHEVSHVDSLTPITHGIVGAELMSILICMMLLILPRIRNEEKTKCSHWFATLAAADLTGTAADALSWLLDGCERLNALLFASTAISMVMTLVMIGLFVSYLSEYIRERERDRIPELPVILSWTYVCITVVLTIAASLSGDLFTLEDGVYSEGSLYLVYVAANALSMAIGVVVVFLYRKVLDRVDLAISFTYMLFPVAMAIINLFIPDWGAAYPAVTLSMVLVYVTMQTEQVHRLELQGQIVSYHAEHDELTGLYNRHALNEKLAVLGSIEGTSGVIFGDINGLKYTNDTFGHAAGDELLIRYAKLLSGIFRSTDLFRISGDEFICLMQNVTEESFNERAEELRTTLAQDAPPLASFGTAFGSNHELSELMTRAEEGMAAEKKIVHERFPQIKR